MTMLNSNQFSKGFTLIELVIVIVILGILAVTAAPRFIDLSDDANDAVTQSMMAGFKSGLTLMNAKYLIKQTSPILINGQSVTFSDAGWPKGSTDNSAGCAELWSRVFADPQPVNVMNDFNSALAEGWNTVYYADASAEVCAYLKSSSAGTLSGYSDPYFVYFIGDTNYAAYGYEGAAGQVKMYNL